MELILNKNIYWLGKKNISNDRIIYINDIKEIPIEYCGILCINIEKEHEIKQLLTSFYQHPGRWSWGVYTTIKTLYTECVTDGVFDLELSLEIQRSTQEHILLSPNHINLNPIIGWLGVNKNRRLKPIKDIFSHTIYSYPLVDLLLPEINSNTRYLQSELERNILSKEKLIDRIRLCPNCNSGHLNYTEECPSCKSINIDCQSSLHCFTCGYVGEQILFQIHGKLECPKCLSSLKHIGVDYDRPLENYICNDCSERFIESSTSCHCLNCSKNSDIDELVIRKLYQYSLGDRGKYIFINGNDLDAPILSIKNKVNIDYFTNLLNWINKLAIRHNEHHLLLGLYLPSLDEYGKHHGDDKLYLLTKQITNRLGESFRDTDICCQYKEDILYIFMANTDKSRLNILEHKLSTIMDTINERTFIINVFCWELPQVEIKDNIIFWLESITGDIYASR
ncbi:TackOD1 domain-containing metal-binding protein [Photobacterium damselae]|uniref:TackOD1 domain-containing metal-binding protein n=1 Tax=Photobacterium damselae TaxID=38293 RepID=UPI004068B52C